MIRTYSELIKLPTFSERFKYLKLTGVVGEATFGSDRFLNQTFYSSYEWKRIRNEVIVRDCGCDLGIDGLEIPAKILIHHMNPITIKDLETRSDILMNPEYLICTCKRTHDAIHFGDESVLTEELVIRHPGDTCPWL